MQDCSRESDVGVDSRMDTIRLTGIQADGSAQSEAAGIGFPSLRADVTLFLDLQQAARTGDITQTVDYEQIARRVASALQVGAHELLESTAMAVAESVLLSHRVERVKVTLHQRRRIPAVSLEEISVTLHRSRSQTSDTSQPSVSSLTGAAFTSDERRHAAEAANSDDGNAGDGSNSAEGRTGQTAMPTAVRHQAIIAMSTQHMRDASRLFRMSIVMLDGVPGNQVLGISPLYGFRSEKDERHCSAVVMVDCVVGTDELNGVLHSIERSALSSDATRQEARQGMSMHLLRYDEHRYVSAENDGDEYSRSYPEVREAWAELERSAQQDGSGSRTAEMESSGIEGHMHHPAVSKLSEDWILGGMA